MRIERYTMLPAAVLAVAIVLGAIAFGPAGDLPAPSPPKQLWFYASFNLAKDELTSKLEDLMRRAAAAGYHGLILGDSRFSRLADVEPGYFVNVERIKKLAAELPLEVVPAVFPLGYSQSILWHDPNLAEGMPVRDAPFVVEGGVARLVPDRRRLAEWSWKDSTVGDDLHVGDAKAQNARVAFELPVSPFRQYHVSARIKTQDLLGSPRIRAYGGGRPLEYVYLGVASTQDWKEHHVTFNSLDNSKVTVYFLCANCRGGDLWWSDLVFEEVALLNLVRRDGAPLSIRTEEGVALVEGEHFERVVDPKMGVEPWSGRYKVWHEPPVIKTSVPDGTRLRVSYYHAVTIHRGQVMMCLSEPETVELLRDQARRMHEAWGAKAYFMWHNEIRTLGWDESCTRRNMTAGQILADNVRTSVAILREVNPGGRIYVWGDMFDPNHNAKRDHYLVRGDLAGSWEGLGKDVIVAPWYYGKRDQSLAWFAGLGHEMVAAAYYDGPLDRVRDWLDSAAKVKGVRGIIYATWDGEYDDLEAFAKVVQNHGAAATQGANR